MENYSFNTRKLIEICREHGVAFVGLFGSAARQEDGPESDIDVLVRFARKTSLLGVVRLERELNSALGRPVDVLTEGALSPYLRDQILSEMVPLYETRLFWGGFGKSMVDCGRGYSISEG